MQNLTFKALSLIQKPQKTKRNLKKMVIFFFNSISKKLYKLKTQKFIRKAQSIQMK